MEENVLPKESHGIGIAKEQSEQSHLSSSPFSTSSTLYAYRVVTHIEVIVSAQTSVSVGLASSGTLYIILLLFESTLETLAKINYYVNILH